MGYIKYISVFLVSINFIFCAYLENIPVKLAQPDGTLINCLTSGDEYYHYLHDNAGYTILQNQEDGFYYYAVNNNNNIVPSIYLVNSINPEDVGLEKKVMISHDEYKLRRDLYWEDVEYRDAPTLGTINNLNVFIRFEGEEEFPNSRSYYDIPFNNPDGPSLGHYFKEVSYDLLTVNTFHYPDCDPSINISYQDEYPRDYYKPYNEQTNPIGYQNDNQARNREHVLLKNAIDFIAEDVPEDLDVDSNNDGYVDNVTFLVRGVPGAWADLLWPHRWVLYSEEAYINGSRVYDYNLNLEQGGYFTVGTLCHEFFHSLGAPDLYHYWDDVAPVAVGGWDVMDASADIPQSMSAYMKYKYTDWITDLPVLTDGGTYEINPLSSPFNNIYRINSPSSNEYFVIEYRVKEGIYEINTPGGDNGILIYRVNDSLNGNADGPPDELYLYRPNGTLNSSGSFAGAPFNSSLGRTEFNDGTNPSCFLYDGSAGGVNISNISSANETMTFDLVNLILLANFEGLTFDLDQDGVANPGEEVLYDFSISNLSNGINAQSIIANIVTTTNDVSIVNPIIDFGNINYNNQEVTSLIINLGQDVFGDVDFNVSIDAEYFEGGQNLYYNEEFNFNIDVSLNQSGFPYSTLNEVRSSPIVSDLDLNGEYELIFGDHFGFIHAIDSNGIPVLTDVFPVDTGGQIWGAPAMADIDNDGFDDIIVTSKSKNIFAIDKNGIKFIVETNSQLIATPTICNMDNDSELEILISGYTNNEQNLWILNHDGSFLENFNFSSNEKNKSGFSVADFNDNNLDDFVFGTDSKNLYLVYDDGTIASGFPFESEGRFRVSPIIVDYQNQKTIIAPSENNTVYAISEEGSIVFEIPFSSRISTTPSVLRLNNMLVIFIGLNDGSVYGFDLSGNILYQYFVDGGVVGSVVFSDIDYDSYPDIVVSSNLGKIYLFNIDGQIFQNFPIAYEFPNSSSPLVYDINQDLDLDIIGGSSNFIYAIDYKQNGNNDEYWYLYKGNNLRNGYYEFNCNVGDLDQNNVINILDVISIVNVILDESNLDDYELCQIDLNGDGNVNVLDVISMTNIILEF